MFKWLNIKNYFRKIRGIRNDIKGKKLFVKHLPELYLDKFFAKYRKQLKDETMYIGVDLIPEIKLQFKDEWELENEEKRRLAIEVSKLNDIFAKYGLLEFVKLYPEKVDDGKHYGFMVEVAYKYTTLLPKTVYYVISYSLFLLSILGISGYLLLNYFL